MRLRAIALSTTVHALGIAAALGTGAVHVAASWRESSAVPSQPLLVEARAEPIAAAATPAIPVEVEANDDASELPPTEVTPVEATIEPTETSTPMPALLPAPPRPTVTLLSRLRPATADSPHATHEGTADADPDVQPAAAAAAAAGALVEPSPLAADNAPPSYPFVAWRRGIEGEVTVLLEIDALGAVTAAHVERSSGFAVLDDAALAALARWRFEPARRGEQSVAGTLHQRVVFRLRDGATTASNDPDQPAR